MTDAEAIKAWLDRWDEHKNDNCYCEKCRHKRAILRAVGVLEELEYVQLGDSVSGEPVNMPARRALASMRETLVSDRPDPGCSER